ncbi:MAG: hypothetical protein QOH12_2712 [Solirubrobacteraceae bacterium]|jgi:hypothetical protein|nr:hypothetical protein [Solirubrobacteraceae bacterium]
MAASTSSLAQIGTLVERLSPLAGKTRGMTIQADDWNALVDVVNGLLGLERTQETTLDVRLEAEFAQKQHDHTGEIGIGALDAELQGRLSLDGGGVATRFQLSDFASKLDALGTELSRLTTLVQGLQGQLDRTSTDELDRATKLRGFESRFSGIEDLRGLVSGISSQVGALKPNIDAALELRSSLAGVDVSALQTRVTAVEDLRQNLLGADGTPLRLRDVELNVKELQDAAGVGGPGGLDTRLAAVQAQIQSVVEARVDSGLADARTAVTAAAADTRAALEADVGARVDQVRTDLAQAADARAVADRSGLEATVSSRLDTLTADLNASVTTTASSLIDARLPAVSQQAADAARAAIAQATPALRDELRSTLQADVDTRLSAAEASFSTRTDALSSQVAARDQVLNASINRVAALEQGQAALSTRVDQTQRAVVLAQPEVAATGGSPTIQQRPSATTIQSAPSTRFIPPRNLG